MEPKILIVDDNLNNVKVLDYLLKRSNYIVESVTSGRAALDAVEQFKPDVVLLDIMLPDIDGYEICRTIKENPENKNIKIIFITAMSRDIDIAKGYALGADDYLVKPYSVNKVMEKIVKIV